MGQGSSKLAFSGRPPTVILLGGLQGSGKTTAAAKLALFLRKKEGRAPALAACDLQRPAAIDQLEQLGRQIQVPVYRRDDTKDAVAVARCALEQARAQGRDVLIVDTAGRLHVDEELMDELAAVRKETKPTNVLLVLDSMTGQDAVNVAEAFAERVAFDGVVLTKLDGDARGGAALSVKAVTGKPIKLASTGEKLDQLDDFHPDRMASRILGMGDVLTLIERAEEAAERRRAGGDGAPPPLGAFTFDDFLKSYEMMRKMGPLRSVLSMVPGLGKQLQGVDVDDRALEWARAIVLSMTPEERRRPELINGSRRARIAPRERHDRPAGEPAAERPQADGEDDEADGQGQDAEPAVDGRRRCGARRDGPDTGRPERRRMAAKIRLARVGSKKNPIYRVVVADSRSPAGRSLHRDRRTLQPADRAVHDRARRGEDQGLAREGRAADRPGQAALMQKSSGIGAGRRPGRTWRSSSRTWPASVDAPDERVASRAGRARRTRSSCGCTSPRTTSAR